jgi:hypothetical protein
METYLFLFLTVYTIQAADTVHNMSSHLNEKNYYANDPILANDIQDCIFASFVPYISYDQVCATTLRSIPVSTDNYETLSTSALTLIRSKKNIIHSSILLYFKIPTLLYVCTINTDQDTTLRNLSYHKGILGVWCYEKNSEYPTFHQWSYNVDIACLLHKYMK